jgi:hypothetical protein
VYGLDIGADSGSQVEGLETEHGSGSLLDGPVILLDEIVEVLRLAKLDRQLAAGGHAVHGRGVGAALADGDFFGRVGPANGLFEEALRSDEFPGGGGAVSRKPAAWSGWSTARCKYFHSPLRRERPATGRLRPRKTLARTGGIFSVQRGTVVWPMKTPRSATISSRLRRLSG